MSPERPAGGGQADGARSPAEGEGTPTPVDMSREREARWSWALLVAGPIIWFTHFMIVYLIAEAGCTGGGEGLRLFQPPVPVTATIIATVVGVIASAASALWAFRHWRASSRELERAPDDVQDLAGDFDDDRRRGTLAFTGLLLSILSAMAILFVGAPALVLGPC